MNPGEHCPEYTEAFALQKKQTNSAPVRRAAGAQPNSRAHAAPARAAASRPVQKKAAPARAKKAGAPAGGNHCVACVTSTDLIHWGDKQIVFTSGISGTYGGPCESPFVEKVGELYFLFIGPWGGYGNGYCDTAVYVSDDPFSFGGEPVGRIPAHAAEVLPVNGAYYITHCGWGQGGVYLAPLHFEF